MLCENGWVHGLFFFKTPKRMLHNVMYVPSPSARSEPASASTPKHLISRLLRFKTFFMDTHASFLSNLDFKTSHCLLDFLIFLYGNLFGVKELTTYTNYPLRLCLVSPSRWQHFADIQDEANACFGVMVTSSFLVCQLDPS